jgi:RNA polymerase sigma factor (TIGR02999 family)
MGTEQPGDLTAILGAVRAGNSDARDRLVRAIYGELRRTAGGLMRRERPDHTLQPSALVHEALLRLLSGQALADAPDRRYLFAAAAQAMRQVLVDHARRHRAAKRPGNRVRVPLDQALVAFEEQGLDVLALHEALEQLALAHPRPAQVVELRFFGGLSVPEVAEALGVSDTTVEGDWRFARAWLRGVLGGTP